MRLLVPILLVLALLAPLAAAYPDPARVPRYYDSSCFQSFDRRFVHDYLGVVEPKHAHELEGAACEVYAKTSAHFVLVTVQDTDGEILENYALHLFEKWGIGQREVNDGLLLLYVRDYSVQGGGGAVRVEVGYGLEGAVNAGVSMDAIRLMQDAKQQALDAGWTQDEAVSFALASGSAFLLGTLDEQYVDGAFPPPAPREGPSMAFVVGVTLVVLTLVAFLHAAAKGRRGHTGWGYRSGSPEWSTGLGGYFAGAVAHELLRGGGGGRFGGGGGGGGFGGGRSGGGGGSGRL